MISFNLHKKFRSSNKEVTIQVEAQLKEGEITAIYGKSGSGKTSILRMIAGLLKPDQGRITVGSENWYNKDEKLDIKTNKRSIGMVFQDYALFPNMTVLQNIEYGLDGNENDELLNRIIKISGLDNLLDRMPGSLSGGQQQRVALARAVVRKPKILLLDESLSALDTTMRIKLQDEILALQKIIPTTIILVSHHLPEVYKMANQVLVMDEGKLIQQGKPSEVFMSSQESELLGELISSIEQQDSSTLLKILVDGKMVNVSIPPKS